MKDIYITKVSRQGTSLGVVIPKPILKAYNWQRGDLVIFDVASNGTLLLKLLTDKDMQNIKLHVD